MSYEWALVLVSLVTVGYMLLSGFRAVMLTDIVQGVIIVIAVIAVLVGFHTVQPLQGEAIFEIRNISVLGVAVLAVFGFVSIFADPTRFQVTLAGRDDASVRRGMLLTLPLLIITALAIYLVAASVYVINDALEAAAVLPIALFEYLPATFLPIGTLLFFVAIMSTVDSVLYALATNSVQLLQRPMTPQLVRRFILLYAVCLVAVSLIFRDVVDIATLSGAVMIVMAVPILYLINGGRSTVRFNLLCGGGVVGMLLGLALVGLEPDAGALVLLGFVVAALIPVSWFRKASLG